MTQLEQFFKTHLEKLKTHQRYRHLFSLPSDTINLMTNDYHGFSHRPIHSGAASGAGGSRLLGGNHPAIQKLETTLRDHLGAEVCLIFPSGFQCHHTVLQTLLGTQQFVAVYDHLNHACLQAGLVSSAPRYRFRHNDILGCQKKLEAVRKQHPSLTPLLVLESIHSMDGTLTPLKAFLELKQKYEAWLVLDEAHAIGVCGKHHLGLADALDVVPDVDILLGTFSKGLGAMGAFVASRSLIAEYLINCAKGFIYTTALSPAIAETVYDRLNHLNADQSRTQILRKRISDFASLSKTFSHHHPWSPIFNLEYDTIPALYEAAQWLETHHIAVGIIRPPTYPEPMLRICLNSGLSESTWKKTLQVFNEFFSSSFLKNPQMQGFTPSARVRRTP